MNNSNQLIRKLLFNKKFTIPFSIILAIVFWLIITVNQNPIREKTISGIKVSVSANDTALEELGLDVVDGGDCTVDVVVSGPNYIVNSLSSDDILVSPVLTDVTKAGTCDIPLVAAANSSAKGYTIVSVNPSKISVKFDYVDTKTFDVSASAEGIVATDGLVAETAVVTDSENKTITIKGARTDIDKIASVVAVAKFEKKKKLGKTGTFDADIKLFDEDGNELDVSKYTLSFDNIKITVPISRKKTVKVVPAFKNMPEYFKDNPLPYTLDVKSVTIIGPADTVDELESVSLSEIDFNTVSTQQNTFGVNIVLPDGVKIVDNVETVTVKFSLSGYKEKVFKVSEFSFINKESGTTASGRSIANVRICAPSSVIRTINESNLYAEVDLTGKKAGEYSVPVVIRSKASGNLWQVGEYTATVVVS